MSNILTTQALFMEYGIRLMEMLGCACCLMPLFNTLFTISDILGLQQALDEKAANLPSAWQDIPLASGWSNFGIGFATPQCRKLVSDLIEVKGTIKKATAVRHQA